MHVFKLDVRWCWFEYVEIRDQLLSPYVYVCVRMY